MPPEVPSPSVQNRGNLRRASSLYKGGKTEDDKTDWGLVEQYLPLVKSMVGRMRIHFPSTVDVQDIYSIAVTGLVAATLHYDPQKNSSFGAYAAIRIRGALLDELRRMDWMPRSERASVRQFRKAVEELEQVLGRSPEDAEVVEALGLSAKEVAKLKALRKPLVFIPLTASSTDHGEDESPLHEALADMNQPDAREIVEKRELIEQLRVRLDKLPEIPKKVLAMYYLKGMRLAEIALVLGLTESRICQIHAQAITRLRQSLDRHLYSGT